MARSTNPSRYTHKIRTVPNLHFRFGETSWKFPITITKGIFPSKNVDFLEHGSKRLLNETRAWLGERQISVFVGGTVECFPDFAGHGERFGSILSTHLVVSLFKYHEHPRRHAAAWKRLFVAARNTGDDYTVAENNISARLLENTARPLTNCHTSLFSGLFGAEGIKS